MKPSRTTSPRRRVPAALVASLALVLAASGLAACSQADASPPAPPAWTVAFPTDGSTSVAWGTPATLDGISSYVATTQPGGRSCTSTAHACQVTGLANGDVYTVTVHSVGPSGTSAAVSTKVTPGTPWPPRNVNAVAGDTGATVSWTPPQFSSGGPVLGYTVVSSPHGGQCSTTGTSCTVGGLTNDSRYTFAVTATNAIGPSSPSTPSARVTPGYLAAATDGIDYAGPVETTEESTSGATLDRAGGYSVAITSIRALWLFGDTTTFDAGSDQSTGFIPGSTAAEGHFAPGQVPHTLEDVQPAIARGSARSGTTTLGQFIPTPTDTYMPDGTGRPCTPANGASYSARRPTGVALLEDKSQLLVTYTDVCVTSTTSTVEGWGFTTYSPRLSKIKDAPVDVFAPATNGAPLDPARDYGSPMISNGQVTLYSSTCTAQAIACNAGTVSTVTLPDAVSSLQNGANYVAHPAVTDGAGQWMPLGVSVAAASSGLRLIEQTSNSGTFLVYSSSTPTGPWHAVFSGTLPGCTLTPRGACLDFVQHPELNGSTSSALSYYKPDAPSSADIGHVVLAFLPFAG